MNRTIIPNDVQMKPFIRGAYEKYWIKFNGQDYLFKTNKTLKNIFLNCEENNVGEVFISFLSKKLGFNCVQAEFAHSDLKGDGVISKSFITPEVTEKVNILEIFYEAERQQIIHSLDSSLDLLNTEDLMQLITAVMGKDYKLSDNFKTECLQMNLIDFITCQRDRMHRNIELLVKNEDGNNVIHLAPMFDNGLCFMFHRDEEGAEYLVHYLKQLGSETPYAWEDIFYVPNFTSNKIDIDSSFFEKNSAVVKQLAKAIHENKTIHDLFNRCKSLNMDETIKEFEEKFDYKFKPNLKNTVNILYDSKINNLEKELNTIEQNGQEEGLLL